ncbi:MAG: Holliday junction resolvase RuvX [Planctomycetaceae bacterium]|nr:Holliday junction resolvase RuvX [Planctomycetaceae bacterium]
MSTSEPLQTEFPRRGRLLGIDYGTKRVGIAISTGEQTIASPVEIYTRRDQGADRKYYLSVVEDYRPVGLVVGLPMHVGGEEGQKAHEARTYGKWLGEITNLPVTWWDERYTSAVAEEFLLGAELTSKQRKKRIDMVAAQIMLQGYLDYHRPRPKTAADEE